MTQPKGYEEWLEFFEKQTPVKVEFERQSLRTEAERIAIADNERANGLCEWFQSQGITEGEGVCAMATLITRIIGDKHRREGTGPAMYAYHNILEMMAYCLVTELKRGRQS